MYVVDFWWIEPHFMTIILLTEINLTLDKNARAKLEEGESYFAGSTSLFVLVWFHVFCGINEILITLEYT